MANEISYYGEIKSFIEDQFSSNLHSENNIFHIFWGIGEIKANLTKIINEYPRECECAKDFIKNVPPLNVDIFAIVTNGVAFELLILEVKHMKSAGLKEFSQLIGYLLVSGARYGLLINVDADASPRLSQLLTNCPYLSHIITLQNDSKIEHCTGFMRWNSITHNFEYSSFGLIRTISDLTDHIKNSLYSNSYLNES